jgi:hypothetical protein
MGKPFLFVAASCLGIVSNAAETRADWQYTRWGMTPNEVVAASKGTVQLGKPPEGRTYLQDSVTGLAKGTYQTDGASFAAYFHFDKSSALAKVALERTGGTACAALHGKLGERLGKPDKTIKLTYLLNDAWRDAKRGNLVRYVQVGEHPCTITYDRLPRQ